MKLCKLKLKNLNSFRKIVEIDFENREVKRCIACGDHRSHRCRKNNIIGCDLCRPLRENASLEWKHNSTSEASYQSWGNRMDLLKFIFKRTVSVTIAVLGLLRRGNTCRSPIVLCRGTINHDKFWQVDSTEAGCSRDRVNFRT